ncbi:hypothetical protein [Virgibacillus salexigens]|uniref:hypothetical protein n=1 Tax=Virgibacillus salexigens TaxID=61016 RepID=UPI00190B3504|nr:hypothetical protein [Virgibacillus salexigens]
MKNTKILTGEIEVIPYMPIGNVQGSTLEVRTDILLKMSTEYGIDVCNGDFEEFLFDAVQHFIFMLELYETKEKELPEPDMLEKSAEIKKQLYLRTNGGHIDKINAFINDALEDYMNYLNYVEREEAKTDSL